MVICHLNQTRQQIQGHYFIWQLSFVISCSCCAPYM